MLDPFLLVSDEPTLARCFIPLCLRDARQCRVPLCLLMRECSFSELVLPPLLLLVLLLSLSLPVLLLSLELVLLSLLPSPLVGLRRLGGESWPSSGSHSLALLPMSIYSGWRGHSTVAVAVLNTLVRRAVNLSAPARSWHDGDRSRCVRMIKSLDHSRQQFKLQPKLGVISLSERYCPTVIVASNLLRRRRLTRRISLRSHLPYSTDVVIET